MKHPFLILVTCFTAFTTSAVTIEECVEKAQSNYPTIKQYSLLDAQCNVDLSDINKLWFPRISAYGQATAQNKVAELPAQLRAMLDELGGGIRGLGKVQYKVGIDLNQTIWDGGKAKTQRELTKSLSDVQRTSLDVELYEVRQRVENLFFAILLTDEQIRQNRITRTVVENNLKKVRSMLANGTATQSDADMLEAQILSIDQNIDNADSTADGLRRMLELFVGETISEPLEMPSAQLPDTAESNRPELRLFDSNIKSNNLQLKLSDKSLVPTIGFFAQSYYGYPGYDYFKSMLNRDWSFNIMAGVKIAWNIDSFYNKRNLSRRNTIANESIAAQRETFLFNSSQQTASQMAAIDGLKKVMVTDNRIVELRGNIRRAAESQLDNGIIDSADLLSKIADENIAELTKQLHKIEYLQEIYKLKYTLNR
ncbi:MAG: TolC family protein [Candidatus Limisoma sp.]